jgi:hypothetical protein
MNNIAISVIVGFIGDFLLQLLTHYGFGGPTGWGLNEYFQQHGSQESLYIAGGMMGLFYIIYEYGLRLEYKPIPLIIYGIVLDYLFRVFMIFPSLKGYYNHLNHFWSAVWGAIPMLLPYCVSLILKNNLKSGV